MKTLLLLLCSASIAFAQTKTPPENGVTPFANNKIKAAKADSTADKKPGASANEKIITYKDGVFVIPDPIPYGEFILISGQTSSKLLSVTVTSTSTSSNPINQTVKGELADANNWTAKVGPFALRSTVILSVTTNAKITTAEVAQLKGDMTGLLIGLDSPALDQKQLQAKYLKDLHSKGWGNYFLPNGKPLDSTIAGSITPRTLNGLNDMKKLSASEFIKFVKASTSHDADIRSVQHVFAKGLSFDIDTTALANLLQKDTAAIRSLTGVSPEVANKNVLAEIIRKAKKNFASYQALAGFFKGAVQSSQQSTHAASASVSADVSGLTSYLGIDAGFTLIDGITKSGVFINLSPYLRKTDPDADYPLYRNGEFIKKNVWYIFTPTVGFGLGTGELKDIKPIYFVGVSVRFNRIIRFGVGKTYYKPADGEHYNWKTAVTIGLNVSYLGDLLKNIASAQTSIGK